MFSAVSGLALASSAVDAKSVGLNARSGGMGGAQRSMPGVERRGTGMANSMRTTSRNNGRTAKSNARGNPERKFMAKNKTTQKKTSSKTAKTAERRNNTKHAKVQAKQDPHHPGHDEHHAHKKKHHVALLKGLPGLVAPPVNPPLEVDTAILTPPTGGHTRERPGTGNPNAVPTTNETDPNAPQPTYSEDREVKLRQGMVDVVEGGAGGDQECIRPFPVSVFPGEQPATTTTEGGTKMTRDLRELIDKLADLYKKIGQELSDRANSWTGGLPNFGSYDRLSHLQKMAAELERRIWIYKKWGADALNQYDNHQNFGVMIDYLNRIQEIQDCTPSPSPSPTP
jgi:hypothetical protein